jgi:hypothetical protein
MTPRSRVTLAVLWALSLFAVAEWSTEAQVTQIGTEVRFVQGQGKGGRHGTRPMNTGTPSVSAVPSAPQDGPVLAGTWRAVSGMPVVGGADRLTIEQDGGTFKIHPLSGLGVDLTPRTYRMSGGDSRNESGAGESAVIRTSRVEWIGAALAITSTIRGSRAGKPYEYQEFEAYSLNRDGELVATLIYTPLYRGTMGTSQIVYRKE